MPIAVTKPTGRVNYHRDLLVWQKGMDLVDHIYDLAELLPRKETYGLSSQLTRAAVSVPTNVAEGRARSTAKDFANFLTNARSSIMEIDTLLEVARRRHFISDDQAAAAGDRAMEISRMLSSLRSKILQPRRANNAHT